jgi:hypothetical protein
MAAGDTMTFVINDTSTGGTNPSVQVKVTENADGTLSFEITQLVVAGAYLGDLRGFFIDFPDAGEHLGGLTATDQTLNPDGDGSGTATQTKTAVVGDDSVTSTGGSNNLNGLNTGAGGFDFGLEIGSDGIGTNDVRSFSFTLDANAGLTLADLANATFGVRLTSVGQDTDGDGEIDTARTGSSKIGETTFDPNFTTVNDETTCVDEGTTFDGNVLDNDDGSTPDDEEIPANLLLTAVKVDANDDGDFDDAGESFAFDALKTSNSWDLGTTGATLTINSDGSYQVDATGSGALTSADHIDFNVEYTAEKTFLETNGSVAGTSTETAKLLVEICGLDGGGGGGGGPPPDASALSHGYWMNHPFTDSEGFAAGVDGETFDDFFNLDVNGARTWTDANGTMTDPPKPELILYPFEDLSFSQAVAFGNGAGSGGDTTTPVVAGTFEDLTREAATAVLNFYDDDSSESFVEWYIYLRNQDDNDDDATNNPTDADSVLADLKQQVQDTFDGAADAYSVTELAELLHATHH